MARGIDLHAQSCHFHLLIHFLQLLYFCAFHDWHSIIGDARVVHVLAHGKDAPRTMLNIHPGRLLTLTRAILREWDLKTGEEVRKAVIEAADARSMGFAQDLIYVLHRGHITVRSLRDHLETQPNTHKIVDYATFRTVRTIQVEEDLRREMILFNDRLLLISSSVFTLFRLPDMEVIAQTPSDQPFMNSLCKARVGARDLLLYSLSASPLTNGICARDINELDKILCFVENQATYSICALGSNSALSGSHPSLRFLDLSAVPARAHEHYS